MSTPKFHAEHPPAKAIEMICASISNYLGYVVLWRIDRDRPEDNAAVYLGKVENYDYCGLYDNSDQSLVFVSRNLKVGQLLCGNGWCAPQRDLFSAAIYAEFAALKNGLLKQFEETCEIRFNIILDGNGKTIDPGVPFQWPLHTPS